MLTRTGDLLALALAGEFDAIVHGCNCHCTFGRGIAAAIAPHTAINLRFQPRPPSRP
jgi:O-acetyl-ADP-ribose deacetylase (regulator of RNase III)